MRAVVNAFCILHSIFQPRSRVPPSRDSNAGLVYLLDRARSPGQRPPFKFPSPIRWEIVAARSPRIRGKNTTPEKRVRSLLHRLGFRFRLYARIPVSLYASNEETPPSPIGWQRGFGWGVETSSSPAPL